MKHGNAGVSRRTIIGCGVAAVAGVALAGTARAQEKIAQEAVLYVAKTENPEQFCANCTHWQGTPVASYAELDEADPAKAACAIVAGEILSTGWCGVWAGHG